MAERELTPAAQAAVAAAGGSATQLDTSDYMDLARAIVLVHNGDTVIHRLLAPSDINRLRAIECEEIIMLARALLGRR